jgi:hypothetical protein
LPSSKTLLTKIAKNILSGPRGGLGEAIKPQTSVLLGFDKSCRLTLLAKEGAVKEQTRSRQGADKELHF